MVLNRIGLTGATGMLGRHLQTTLAISGVKVIAVSRPGAAGIDSRGWDLSHWRSPAELDAMFADAEAVVHAGAMTRTYGFMSEELMFNANVRACLNLGQWAISRDVPIVHISGAIVYADPNLSGLSEDSPLGWSGLGGFYGFSKLLAEDVFARLRQQGLKLAVVRPSSIYGPGLANEKMISRFLATANVGGVIELAPPAHDRVDLVHAADVSRAVLTILERGCWDTFNIASGRPVSIGELAKACVSATGRGSISIGKEGAKELRPATRFSLDISRARARLGWKPLLGIVQGLSTMLQKGALRSQTVS